mgnify:FL=1
MKNFKKRDIAYLWILALSFLVLVFVVSNTMYLYGSQLDWYAEHVTIPEYFRTLFYHTKDLFPDFAANIGSGQNIYNLSYYGLLSPITLISYLLPNVNMTNYMIISTIITVIISTILLYIFLKNKNYSSETCFVASFIFIMSASITLHSHRHIMFINYMPFLLLGFLGVDKKFASKRSWLLTLSIFLMIMTSYYFSIGGIFTLIIYGIYKYLASTNKVTLKSFIKTGLNFLFPFIIAIISASIIILPTLATIVNNRAASNITISLKDLLLPTINTEYLLYDSYGLGLTAIAVPALINFFKNKKENFFLAITLSLLIIFPIFNYILNGTMYIDSKTLIPLLPLYILVIAEFIENTFAKKINYKVLIPILLICSLIIYFHKYKEILYLIDIVILVIFIFIYNKSNKKILLIIPIILTTLVSAYNINKSDELVLKYTTKENEKIVKNSLNEITENDHDFYRISNDLDISETVNKIYNNINYYQSTIYSSVSNQIYNEFYFDIINNNIPSRNRALTVTTGNIMSLMLTNNKYIISRNKALQGYELLSSENGLNIYKNDNTMPLGFATSNIMSYEDFNRLPYAVKEEALLKLIVTDSESKNNFATSMKKVDLKLEDLFNSANAEISSETVKITTDETLKLKYTLPADIQNKILFIRFKMNHKQTCSEGDQVIRINNVKNKLTCSSWKYYNNNETFDYVLAEQDLKELTISIYQGKYELSDFEIYSLDYATIEQASSKVDKLVIDKNKTIGDIIEGNIEVTEDGYFMATIPYDSNFVIKVDNKKVAYEKVDEAFIGFKISKGNHQIKIEYKAPLKNLSLLLSFIGIIMFVLVSFLESRRKI